MSQESTKIERTIVIARPLDEVWKYIADPRNDPKWCEVTRLTQRDQIEWKIPRFQVPIARRMVSRDIENQLLTLKSLLETG